MHTGVLVDIHVERSLRDIVERCCREFDIDRLLRVLPRVLIYVDINVERMLSVLAER